MKGINKKAILVSGHNIDYFSNKFTLREKKYIQ